MSKLIIIFCVAVFASATHAASIEKPQTFDELKKECIDVINSEFDRLEDSFRKKSEESKTEESRAIYDNAISTVQNLINQLEVAESIDQTRAPHNVFVNFPAKCGGELADAMDALVWNALVVSGTIVMK